MTLFRRMIGFLSGLNESAFWTVSVSGRVVGSLVYQAGEWRLSWFDGADPRASGSPNTANTSQCPAHRRAPSDEPSKNRSGCGFWNGWMSDFAPHTR